MARATTHLIVMSEFHQSKAWRKASKAFKNCVDCGKPSEDAGHILPVSRYPMMGLWQSNLVNQCGPCNAKLGNKIRWSIRAILLWVVYGMIKILTHGINIIIFLVLARFIYLDITYNASIITDQLKTETYEILDYISDTFNGL